MNKNLKVVTFNLFGVHHTRLNNWHNFSVYNCFCTYNYGEIISHSKCCTVNIINSISLEMSWIQNKATSIV